MPNPLRRALGRTGLSVSPICIGGWQLAGPLTLNGLADGHPDPGKKEVLRLIRELGERGINHIDTAEQYGDGEGEIRVGKALERRRDEWVISSKFGYRVSPSGDRIADSSPPTIMTSLEGSLQRLRTDHLDIFLYHCAPDWDDLDEAVSILNRAKEQGKIRATGISTRNADHAKLLRKIGLLDVVQFPTNILNPAHELLHLANENGVGVQARGVLAEGRLGGRYQDQVKWLPDDIRSVRAAGQDFSKYLTLSSILDSELTMAQIAYLWTLSQPGVSTICLGAKSLADYETILKVVNQAPLPPESISKLGEWGRQFH